MSSSRLDGGRDRSRSEVLFTFLMMGHRQRGEALGRMFASMTLRNVDRLDLLEREHLTAQAMLGSLIAVLDEYDRTGAWPEDASGLRRPDGREVGIDPANGLPFRIRVVDDRLSLYTLGIDRIDHEGWSGKREDGTIGDDFSVPIYSWTLKPPPIHRASEPVPERVSEFEIPRQWKGVGIILASLSFGAVALWLRRRNA